MAPPVFGGFFNISLNFQLLRNKEFYEKMLFHIVDLLFDVKSIPILIMPPDRKHPVEHGARIVAINTGGYKWMNI